MSEIETNFCPSCGATKKYIMEYRDRYNCRLCGEVFAVIDPACLKSLMDCAAELQALADDGDERRKIVKRSEWSEENADLLVEIFLHVKALNAAFSETNPGESLLDRDMEQQLDALLIELDNLP